MKVKHFLVYLKFAVILHECKYTVRAVELKLKLFTRNDIVTGTLLTETSSPSTAVCADLCLGKRSDGCSVVRYRKHLRRCQLIVLDSGSNTEFAASSEWQLFVTEIRCPQDWIKIDSSCYYLATELMTWADAELHCEELGGTLAAITTKEESSSINAWLVEKGVTWLVWIGGNDIAVEGTWEWSTGEAFAFEEMSTLNEPNGFTYENCLAIYVDFMGWADFGCINTLSNSVCEKGI